jgi:hypothetical protein
VFVTCAIRFFADDRALFITICVVPFAVLGGTFVIFVRVSRVWRTTAGIPGVSGEPRASHHTFETRWISQVHPSSHEKAGFGLCAVLALSCVKVLAVFRCFRNLPDVVRWLLARCGGSTG